MKSCTQFIKEQLKVDNPGGTWLQHKQEDADSLYHRHKGMGGAVTGYYPSPLKLDPQKIKHLPGARGEEAYRHNSPKLHDLEKQVGDPSNFDTKGNSILIGVNHRGEPHVIEGNHRLAYAVKHKIPHIHADVRYYNGGEAVDGPMHPSRVETYRSS